MNNDNFDTADTYTDSCNGSKSFDYEKKASENKIDDGNDDSINSLPASELLLIKESKKYFQKIKDIEEVLLKEPVNIKKLKKLAISEFGLVNDNLRKIAWPLLVGLVNTDTPKEIGTDDLKNHPEYQQVILDVNRSLSRFPPGIPLEQRLSLQEQLAFLILRVVTVHPKLKYYQGYHDVAVTLLLVTGIDKAYLILEKLSTNHLKDCMEPTMEKTSNLLNYIYPLVKRLNREVYDYLENSGVGTLFALPWVLTWFGHSLSSYQDIVRLFDFFLASEPLSPLYLSAVIIVFRANDILNTPCDMANLHHLLSQIPHDLPFEKLLTRTVELYKSHPPEKIHQEASNRTKEEEEKKKKEYALRLYRRNKNLPFLWRMVGHFDPERRLPIWALAGNNNLRHNLRQYKFLVATATFAFGLYAVYLNSVTTRYS